MKSKLFYLILTSFFSFNLIAAENTPDLDNIAQSLINRVNIGLSVSPLENAEPNLKEVIIEKLISAHPSIFNINFDGTSYAVTGNDNKTRSIEDVIEDILHERAIDVNKLFSKHMVLLWNFGAITQLNQLSISDIFFCIRVEKAIDELRLINDFIIKNELRSEIIKIKESWTASTNLLQEIGKIRQSIQKEYQKEILAELKGSMKASAKWLFERKFLNNYKRKSLGVIVAALVDNIQNMCEDDFNKSKTSIECRIKMLNSELNKLNEQLDIPISKDNDKFKSELYKFKYYLESTLIFFK